MQKSTIDAIRRCHRDYFKACNEYVANNGGPQRASKYLKEQAGAEAFRNALPYLTSRQNIQDFMACVAEGLLTDCIAPNLASKLISTAQAALKFFPRQTRQKRAKKSQKKAIFEGAQIVNRVSEDSTDSKQEVCAENVTKNLVTFVSGKIAI
jgi:hypothetical protein